MAAVTVRESNCSIENDVEALVELVVGRSAAIGDALQSGQRVEIGADLLAAADQLLLGVFVRADVEHDRHPPIDHAVLVTRGRVVRRNPARCFSFERDFFFVMNRLAVEHAFDIGKQLGERFRPDHVRD